MSHFRYWVSNDPFNPDSTLRNWYWNTKQKIGEPDSVDAESLEVAKFKDGYYWVIDLCRFKYNEIGGLK